MAKKKKGGGFGGLADAFVKGGVASDKEARKSRRERAGEDRELGRAGVDERERRRLAELNQAAEQEKERQRALAAAQREGAEAEALVKTIRTHADTGRGPRRWFFVTRDGRIPFLEVSDGASRLLSDGHAGIVESLGAFTQPHVVVAGRQALERLDQAEPELIRFWNREARPR